MDLFFKFGNVIFNNIPNNLIVNVEVLMHNSIAQTDYLIPGNFMVSIFQTGGKGAARFP